LLRLVLVLVLRLLLLLLGRVRGEVIAFTPVVRARRTIYLLLRVPRRSSRTRGR
jgi:hypothetical protein